MTWADSLTRIVQHGRLLRLAAVAAAALASATGCGLTTGPQREPIDGLEMHGHDDRQPAKASDDQGDWKRLDLRV
jgi:hypothetical protein